MRNTIKALVGIASGLALLTLLAGPAAASPPYTFDVASGTLNVYALFDAPPTPPVTSVAISGGTPCSSSNTLTVPSAGTVAATISSTSQVTIGGDDFLSEMTISLTGTYDGSFNTSGTADAHVELTPDDGGDPCVASGDFCEVDAVNIALSGVFSANPNSLGTSDTVTLSGNNSDFELTVVENDGNPSPVCGVLSGAADGHVEAINIVATNFI